MGTVLQLVLGLGDDKLWQALAGVVDDVDEAKKEAAKKWVNEEEARKRQKEEEGPRKQKTGGQVKEKMAAEERRRRLRIRWRRRERPTKGYNKSQGEARKRRQPIERRRRKRVQPIERRRRPFVNNTCDSFSGYVNIEFGQ